MDFPLAKHCDDQFTDKNSLHSYLHVYETLLKDLFVKNKSIRLIEIGIQRGGSISMWLNALPTSKIVGVDCQKTCTITHPNYTEVIDNAYDHEILDRIGMADLIIDDGSHAYGDLCFFIKNYPYRLSMNGYAVIEDLPDVAWLPKLQALLPIGFKMEFVDMKAERNGRFDNQMLIIKRANHQ